MLNKFHVLVALALAAIGASAQGEAQCRDKGVCGQCVYAYDGNNNLEPIKGWCHHVLPEEPDALYCGQQHGCADC
ncbi:unnamed protein product [Cercospora beticola]|nr:unnamed protein product [Cercospora beticola]